MEPRPELNEIEPTIVDTTVVKTVRNLRKRQ